MPDRPTDPTESLRPQSDPREVQRRFREAQPERIGPYRILETLGEGGMGTVYLAEQEKPIRRRVALKVLKLGMDSRQVIARFEAERQALALMNHANVARVFDAGTTETGQPYFVMEHVEGTPITVYCDQARLSTERRLRLFMDVCMAVQHAHQKGIIHRDIKPSNVLVAEIDGKPVAKVIDFGIAKATEQNLIENTYFTEAGQLIGTPAYMSPEQAGADPADIDTRTDIYSLGALLYELLAGTPPFDPKSLRQVALAEIQRIIREVDPPKPSTRLGALGAEGTAVRASRGTETRSLARNVRGDLDWIVMKCLEKDRARRYETANALALEIRRYLCSEPVLAGPPSAAYRMRKFVRRNRAAVVSLGTISLLLAGSSLGMTVLYLRAEQEAETARRERDKTAKFADFMEETLRGVGPSVALGRDTTILKELMDRAAERIEHGELQNVPGAELRLRLTIGDVYRYIAAYDAAEKMISPTLDLAGRIPATEEGERAAALIAMARWLRSMGRSADALPLAEESLAEYRRLYSGDHRYLAYGMADVAYCLLDLGRTEEALRYREESLAMRQRLYPDDHEDLATGLLDVAACLNSLGRPAEALPLFEQSLAMRRRLYPENHPAIAHGLRELARCLRLLGRAADALPQFEEAAAMYQRLMPGDHPSVAGSLNELAFCLNSLGRSAEALPKYEEALAMYRRLFPGDHPDVAGALNNVANCQRILGRLAEALPVFQQALAMYQRLFSGDHPNVAKALNNVALTIDGLGRSSEALPLHEQSLAMRRRIYPGDHPDVATGLHNVGACLESVGRLEEALPRHEEALAIFRRLYPGDHPDVAAGLGNLAHCLQALGRVGRALGMFEESLAMNRRLFAGDHPDVAAGLNNIAACLRFLDRCEEALPRFEEALSMYQRLLPDNHPTIASVLNNMASCLHAVGRAEEALAMYEASLTIYRKRLPPTHWLLRVAEIGKGQALAQLERYDEAEDLLLSDWENIRDRTDVPDRFQRRCLEALIDVYEARHAADPDAGHDTKAEEWRAKLDELEAGANAGSSGE